MLKFCLIAGFSVSVLADDAAIHADTANTHGQGGHGSNNQAHCGEGLNCSDCTSHNDPHFRTLDGIYYDHHAAGNYAYVHECFEKDMPFQIFGQHYPCSSGSSIMCLGDIELFFPATSDTLKISGNSSQYDKMYHNAATAASPSNVFTFGGTSAVTVNYTKGSNLHEFVITTSEPNEYAYVSYTFYGGNLEMWLSDAFHGSSCGLCGYFNGDDQDDFLDKYGEQFDLGQNDVPQNANQILEFAETYEKNGQTPPRRLIPGKGKGTKQPLTQANDNAASGQCTACCNRCRRFCNQCKRTSDSDACEKCKMCKEDCEKALCECDDCKPFVEGDRNQDGVLDCYDVAYDCCVVLLSELLASNPFQGWTNKAKSLAEFKQQFLLECALDGELLTEECLSAEELLAEPQACDKFDTSYATRIAKDTMNKFSS